MSPAQEQRFFADNTPIPRTDAFVTMTTLYHGVLRARLQRTRQCVMRVACRRIQVDLIALDYLPYMALSQRCCARVLLAIGRADPIRFEIAPGH
jgi:hypothetical protein